MKALYTVHGEVVVKGAVDDLDAWAKVHEDLKPEIAALRKKIEAHGGTLYTRLVKKTKGDEPASDGRHPDAPDAPRATDTSKPVKPAA